MKIVGVITEYNPFHAGHAYQLEQIRQHSQCDVLVVLMSGNVVQRGEFAILDKWERAQIALQSGADVVFELPLYASLQSADYFAKVSVELLSQLLCQVQYCGVESATTEQLMYHVRQLQENKSVIDEAVQQELKKGYAYPAAYSQAMIHIFGETELTMPAPNHQLAIQYLKYNQKLSHPMQFEVIPRLFQQGPLVLSASQVRQRYFSKKLQQEEVPDLTWNSLNRHQGVAMEDYWALLKYRLMTHTPESLRDIYLVKEGFEFKVLKEVKKAASYTQFVNQLISKRWTRSAVQRLLMAILGNVTLKEWQTYEQLFQETPSVRLLGFRQQTSSAYLRLLQRTSSVHVMTKLTQNTQKVYSLQQRMDTIYVLNQKHRIPQQNTNRFPIILTEKYKE